MILALYTTTVEIKLSSLDFDTDMPTSWRVFLIWPTVVKGLFFTRKLIILSSNLFSVVFWVFSCC